MNAHPWWLSAAFLVYFIHSPLATASEALPQFEADELCVQESLCRQCDGPACMAIAKPRDWPKPALNRGLNFKIGAFSLVLPANSENVIVLNNSAIVRYPGKRYIAIDLVSADRDVAQNSDLAQTLAKTKFSYSDMPRILYSHTPKDDEPPDLDDKRFWRMSLTAKHSHFEHAKQVFASEKGNLTAFYRDAGAADVSAVADIVHAKIRSSFLRVSSRGLDFKHFERIIGTIKTTKE